MHKGVIIHFGQKIQTFSTGTSLADSNVVPYALAVADLNKDGKVDISRRSCRSTINGIYNDGTGHNFTSISFGDSKGTVYGFTVGDFNEDEIPDIAAARPGATRILYFGHIKSKNRK